eukprot:1195095-Prorocentrum_minimum.AAC.1
MPACISLFRPEFPHRHLSSQALYCTQPPLRRSASFTSFLLKVAGNVRSLLFIAECCSISSRSLSIAARSSDGSTCIGRICTNSSALGWERWLAVSARLAVVAKSQPSTCASDELHSLPSRGCMAIPRSLIICGRASVSGGRFASVVSVVPPPCVPEEGLMLGPAPRLLCRPALACSACPLASSPVPANAPSDVAGMGAVCSLMEMPWRWGLVLSVRCKLASCWAGVLVLRPAELGVGVLAQHTDPPMPPCREVRVDGLGVGVVSN